MSDKPMRLRRSQLAVPGVSEKMLTKAAASAADHVFCDLEDAVAPSAKAGARDTIADALNNLDWGNTVRCVRVNDVGTEWCYEDIITIVEKAGKNLDTIMLPKPLNAGDVEFADKLLSQLEMKLGLEHKIGLEVLIEEVEAMQNVVEIANSCERLECMIFGMGDYAASQGLVVKNIGNTDGYPGDIFHYPRYHMTIAARAPPVLTPLTARLLILKMTKPIGSSANARSCLAWSGNGPSIPAKLIRHWKYFRRRRAMSISHARLSRFTKKRQPKVWVRSATKG